MADILFDIVAQIRAIEQMDPVRTFLTELFTKDEGAIMAEDAIFDFRKGDEILAPFVVPHAGGKVVGRGTFDTKGISFPSIAPELPIDYLDYGTRMFGERIMGGMTPEQRQRRRLAEDFVTLRRRIQNTREFMAAQLLFTGRLDIMEYTNDGDTVVASKYIDCQFENFFTPVTKWDQPGADIVDDCLRMFDIVMDGQGSVEIGIMDTETRSAMMSNDRFLKLLDVRNLDVGSIAPGMPRDAVQYVGTILKNGVDLFVYSGSYREQIGGPKKRYVPQGKILFGPKKNLRMIHGPVVQVEKDGEEPKIYAKKEVPFRHSTAGGTVMKQRLTSRPIMIPENVSAWVVGNVMD